MKYIVSGSEMKKVDNYTINHVGVPSLVLMERAAVSVVDLIVSNEKKTNKILVVCGSGNNGADGVAIARILKLKGYDVTIYLAGNMEHATVELKQQISIAKNVDVRFCEKITGADVVVDALLGMGLSRDVEGIYFDLIKKINEFHGTVYAVDIPSGIDADNGRVHKIAVKADYTVTFGCNKIGTVLYPGAEYCGKLTIADIGFPESAYEQLNDIIGCVDNSELSLIPKRPNYSNKGSFGKVLIIAGSKDMSGAAVLTSMSAFRVGAGLVRVFTANENKDIINKLVPEAIVNTYGASVFDKKALESAVSWSDVIAIGPGFDTGVIQKMMVENVLDAKKPTVIDADAINNISMDIRLTKKFHKKVIITPHLGEMSRLMKRPIKDIQDDLIQTARNVNYKYNINCVLKDARTIIVAGKNTYVNTNGNNGMATAGSGDVLTGIIVGLLGIGTDINAATVLGPYIHGIAGDIAAKNVSKTSMMATDIIQGLTEIFK